MLQIDKDESFDYKSGKSSMFSEHDYLEMIMGEIKEV